MQEKKEFVLGIILDEKLEEELKNNGYKKVPSPDNMINFANDTTILSFYLSAEQISFLWSINIIQSDYSPLNIKEGEEPELIDNNLTNNNYHKQMDSTIETGKRMIQYGKDGQQIYLHFTDNKLTTIQIMLENPASYVPLNSKPKEEKIDYQLGMILDENLKQKLVIKGFTENIDYDANIYSFIKPNLMLDFIFLGDNLFILKNITLSIGNHEDSILGMKMDNTLEEMINILQTQAYQSRV